MNFNFVGGRGRAEIPTRPDVMMAMKNALPPNANFTTCAVGPEQFPANVLSFGGSYAGGNGG